MKMEDFINIDNFIKDIVNNIKAIEMTNNGTRITRTNLTKAIKKAVIDVKEKYNENFKEKEKNNLLSNCNIGEEYKHNGNKEWVYDLIIYSNKDNYIIDKVYLVGESELEIDWDAILEDFGKLLFARAEVRLMVYKIPNNNDNDEYKDYKKEFEEIIEKSSSCLNGDIYLFAVYDENEGKWEYTKYVKGLGEVNI